MPCRGHWLLLALLGVSLLWPRPTQAQAPLKPREVSRWNLRESLAVGALTSNDQIKFLHYDKAGFLFGVHAARAMLPWLELRVGVQGGAFRASVGKTGGLLDFTAGVLLRAERKGLSPYLAADLGPAITQTLWRPYFSGMIGFDTPLVGRHRIGPVVGYSQLFQWQGRGYTTDARSIWVGLSLRQTLGRTPKPAPPPPSPALKPKPKPTEFARPEPAREITPSSEVMELIERVLPARKQSLELLAPVLFRFNSDQLDPTGIAMLHEVRRALEARPEITRVQIEGYADQRGSVAYNEALSLRRAERCRAWLVEHGVASERLEVVAHGAAGPVEQGTDASSREQNRRVIFRVFEERTP